MRKIFRHLIILTFLLNTECTSWQNVKAGLTGEKSKQATDEFLVKKKDPLVLPPRFDELPMPGQSIITEEGEITDIEQLIQLGKDQESSAITDQSKSSGNLEDSILKKIKQK